MGEGRGWERWVDAYLEVERVSESEAAEVGILVYEPGFYTPHTDYPIFAEKHPIGLGVYADVC